MKYENKKISVNQIDFYERLNNHETVEDRNLPATKNISNDPVAGKHKIPPTKSRRGQVVNRRKDKTAKSRYNK